MGIVKSYSKILGKTLEYYSSADIRSYDPLISIIFGARNNGKSYDAATYILKGYLEKSLQGVWIRKNDNMFDDEALKRQFEPLIANGILAKTKWDGIDFKKRAWWLYSYDDELEKKCYDDKPFCHAIDIHTSVRKKGGSFMNIGDCVFDEFLSREGSCDENEINEFQNLVSTLVRMSPNAKFFLIGNTVNPYSPYFDAFGIKVENLKQGNIYVYNSSNPLYKDKKLCVEWVKYIERQDNLTDAILSFFNNNTTKMICSGDWEMNEYPRCPIEILPKDIIMTFYVLYKRIYIKAEVINRNNMSFIYFSECEESVDEDNDIILSPILDPRDNWFQDFRRCNIEIIDKLIRNNKMYYDNDKTGEEIRLYFKYVSSYTIIKK